MTATPANGISKPSLRGMDSNEMGSIPALKNVPESSQAASEMARKLNEASLVRNDCRNRNITYFLTS
jgi:hypothetical protein